MPSWYHSNHNSYEYNRQTKQKVATFYNPNVSNYYFDVQNEIDTIGNLENHVAEVAISFDKPYRYSEIISKIPDDINMVWLYLFSEMQDEELGPSGAMTYDFQLSTDDEGNITNAESDKDSFFNAFESYTSPMK